MTVALSLFFSGVLRDCGPERPQAFAPDCDHGEAGSKAGGRNFWVCLAQSPCSRQCRKIVNFKFYYMTLEQQVHQNDVKLHKLIREVENLKRQISSLTTPKEPEVVHGKEAEKEVCKCKIRHHTCDCEALNECSECGKPLH